MYVIILRLNKDHTVFLCLHKAFSASKRQAVIDVGHVFGLQKSVEKAVV